MKPAAPQSLAEPGSAEATSGAGGERLARIALTIALAGAALLFDPGAADALTAPKRLIVLAAAVAAAVVLLAGRSLRARLPAPGPARDALLALGLACLCVLLSTALAREAYHAADVLRALLLFALLPALGASACLAGRGGARLAAVAAALVATSAVFSLAQRWGWNLPFLPTLSAGGRFGSGALLGNEGHVALACALALPVCLVILLQPTASRRWRISAGVLMALCVAAIAANRQLTAAIAGVAGLSVVVLLALRRERLLRSLALLAVLLAAVLALPPLRAALVEPLPGVEAERVQAITTQRLGAWAAAEVLWLQRPWTGHGPGSFAPLAQEARLAAEFRLGERLRPPVTADAFVEAHNEYLQFAAEAGLPALLLVLLALWRLASGLSARLPRDPECQALLGILAVGGVAALAWFPLQVPFTALLLLLAAGRAWRRLCDAQPAADARGFDPGRGARLLIAAALLLALAPEWPRYRAEHALAEASLRIERVLRGQSQGEALAADLARAEELLVPLQHRPAADPRPSLLLGIALILDRRAAEAETVLRAAIARGERPELVLNLGRALAAQGDEAGARQAFLRAAWASPGAVVTLPRALREALQQEVEGLEGELRAGRLQAVPALPE